MPNEYDKFAEMRQRELKEKSKKSHSFVEKPMMSSMLPNLLGKKILLLGCGTGEEIEILEKAKASNMVGIDLSKRSIEIAKKTYPKYNFLVADMYNIPFEDKSFDFVYSSLVLHYAKDVDKVIKEVKRVLKPGGGFLFSVGHPLRWSTVKINIEGANYSVLGYDNNDTAKENIGEYMSYNSHKHYFPNNEVLEFFSGPPSMYFKLLVKNGFEVIDFSESQCIEECKKIDINYYKRFHEFPQFMAFYSKKI